MKDTIRELIQSGTTPDELRAVIDKYEAEMKETAALAKEAEIGEARMVLMDALAKYYIATDLLTEEEVKAADWDLIMTAFLNMEQHLLNFKKTFTDNHPSIKVKVLEAPGECRNLKFEEFLDEIEKMFKK